MKRAKPPWLTGANSDGLWADFNDTCDVNKIGVLEAEWFSVWPFYFAGYMRRNAEVRAAMV